MANRRFPDGRKCECGKVVMLDNMGIHWEPDWSGGDDDWQIHSCRTKVGKNDHLTPPTEKRMILSLSRQPVK